MVVFSQNEHPQKFKLGGLGESEKNQFRKFRAPGKKGGKSENYEFASDENESEVRLSLPQNHGAGTNNNASYIPENSARRFRGALTVQLPDTYNLGNYRARINSIGFRENIFRSVSSANLPSQALSHHQIGTDQDGHRKTKQPTENSRISEYLCT